jgi:hypothetical protein
VLAPYIPAAIDFGEVWHLALRVPDVPKAMEELTQSMGLRWGHLHHIEMPAWIPGTGYRDLYLNIVYSIEGPVHLELEQGSPDSAWDPALGTGVHHIGLYTDDVGELSAKLAKDGWTVEMACASPEEGYGSWSYMRSPAGLLIEPVSSESKERFVRYWAGESLF